MGGWGKSPRKRVAEPVDNVLSSYKVIFNVILVSLENDIIIDNK